MWTFTFDDANVPNLTVNLNDMTISDGDIPKELNDYGQNTKLTVLLVYHHRAVAESVGSEFGYVDGVIVPIIPETPPVAPEWDGEPIPGVDDVPSWDSYRPRSSRSSWDSEVPEENPE